MSGEANLNDRVLAIIENITGSPEVRHNLDIDLFGQALLDSMAFVELIVRLSKDLSLSIAPSEIIRADWTSPRLIIARVNERASCAA